MENNKRLLLTCYLPCSPSLANMLNELAGSLSKAGVRMVFMAVDPAFGQRIDTAYADIELLAGGLAAYARPDAHVNAEAESEYAHLLADVDANWGMQADSASLLLSLSGVDACRRVAREAFARHRPALALLWSAALFPASRVWRDVARELGVLSFNVERGFLPGTWMLDSEGMYEQSDVLVSPPLRKLVHEHTGRARHDQYREWYVRGRPRKYGEAGEGSQALRERLAPKGLVVCAFGGLDTGALGNGLSANSRAGGLVSSQAMLAALQEMHLDTEATVLFKAHPGSGIRIPPGSYGRVRVLEPQEDPIDLLQMADVVVAGTTSLAYEALLLERPLVQTAVGPLKGLVPLARNSVELGEAIKTAIAGSQDESALAKRRCFLDALLTHYLFAVQSGVPARPLEELVVHLLELSDRSTYTDDCAECNTLALPEKGPGAIKSRSGISHGVAYFDCGNGFSEQSAFRWTICPEAGLDSCLIPVPVRTSSLRLDPADCPCVVRLFDVAWIDSESQTVHPFRLDELVLNGSEVRFQLRQAGPVEFLDLVCTGNDPHFTLPLPDQVAQILKYEQLHLRLTYSVWRFAEGVALQPEEIFQEIRAGAETVVASVHSVASQHQQGISEVRGVLSELQAGQARSDLVGEESRRQLDEIWQRLHRQLGDAAHTLLTAQQGMDEQQLKQHLETREALACSIKEQAQAQISIVQHVAAAHTENLQSGLSSLGKQYQTHAAEMMQGQQRITDDLLIQLKTSEDERKKIASDLSASTQALASARSKLGILENTLAVRLVRALCRLPKDIFSA